ncbi:MAG: phosphate ABC transporter substrate-binding protein [Endomicrobia bacterium]|nr:phosphate ABC transporter substrate-binding protein [Endomicrobiia bacterium]
MKKLMLAAFAVLFCAGNVLAEKVVIEGSTTVLPIAQKAAEQYMDANSKADITVRGGGSGVGINSLIAKTCDIANASRAIEAAEVKTANSKGVNPKAFIIAKDAIAVIVNNANAVSALSKQQVADIFTGKITNWSQVGGKDGKIVVVSRDSASGTFESFNALALHKQKAVADALMQASNQAVVTTVAKTPGAIGYAGIGYLSSSIKALTIEGITPTAETVLNGKYAYSRPLFMYTNGDPKGEAKKFIDFVLSKDGQKIVQEEGFVALK